MKAKILIVEDEKDIRNNLVLLFSSFEYEVSSFVTAEAALEKLSNELPDLIVCDINLPKMNGYMLKKELNKRKDTFEIPFIFLTARDTYDDIRKGMKLAADDFIFKPYKSEDLIESVELRLLKHKIKNKSAGDNFVFLKENNILKKIFLKDITLVLGENQYSRVLKINSKGYLVRRPLIKWESILPENFKRINRSAIANIDKVEEIETSPGGKFLHLVGYSKKIKVTNLEVLDIIMNTKKQL